MNDIAIARTKSEPLSQDALLLQVMSALLEYPCSLHPILWRDAMPNSEPALADWVEANADRVYVVSDDVMVQIYRRWDGAMIFTFRRDSWRSK